MRRKKHQKVDFYFFFNLKNLRVEKKKKIIIRFLPFPLSLSLIVFFSFCLCLAYSLFLYVYTYTIDSFFTFHFTSFVCCSCSLVQFNTAQKQMFSEWENNDEKIELVHFNQMWGIFKVNEKKSKWNEMLERLTVFSSVRPSVFMFLRNSYVWIFDSIFFYLVSWMFDGINDDDERLKEKDWIEYDVWKKGWRRPVVCRHEWWQLLLCSFK